MRKYLLLGLALIFASNFTSALACNSFVSITNASGSPPVVVGNTVQIGVSVPVNFVVDVYLDGAVVLTFPNVSPIPEIVNTTLTVAYGSHTLDSGGCPIEFTVVATAPAPGTPTLSSSGIFVQSGATYTLSWSVPTGTINHYTLSSSSTGNSVLSAGTTSQAITSTAAAGTDYNIAYTVRACSSSDESACSAWSNTVNVDVRASCNGPCH
jgi:hypothetical protein